MNLIPVRKGKTDQAVDRTFDTLTKEEYILCLIESWHCHQGGHV